MLLASFASAQDNTVKAYVVLNPAGDFVGHLKVVSGFATVQGDQYQAKNVVVDLNSLVTGFETRDDHAKNKYLEVKKFPQAILLEASGSKNQGKARIKLRDQIQEVSGTYKVINAGKSTGKSISADFKIKLSEFGIKDISYKGIGVEDDVRIEVVIPIKEAAPQAKAATKAGV
jgi:polyisoprenoid-binding protein YceI